ncbi:hypothetical protein BJ138DRAFT_1152657 [Hygrophoropsis aurantiaca]|uniref:Uncharacterized protein n=1 Tax=Hygrophoropsis aurantiaca TaxID=72124 RepID=A0ACB8ABS3_9AGAM|nr:hypothetical protein BJ138DRAFT_1152657 [Hygrophoropsis aurantiaca]
MSTSQSSQLALGIEHDSGLRHFFSYDFSSDELYQQGLAGILTPDVLNGKSDAESSDLVLRTKVFYFNRMFEQNLTLDNLHAYQEALNVNDTVPRSGELSIAHQEVENRVLTFAELKTLIEQGKTDDIPNNRIIPDSLNTAPPSTSTAPARKKPWETVQ